MSIKLVKLDKGSGGPFADFYTPKFRKIPEPISGPSAYGLVRGYPLTSGPSFLGSIVGSIIDGQGISDIFSTEVL